MNEPRDRRAPPAGGLGSALSALRRSRRELGVTRAVKVLSWLNQEGGPDCPGCAWPDPAERSPAEFCENGAKAVAHEATRRRVGPEFFARHTVSELLERSDHWLEQQGRLTHPVAKPKGSDRYEAISWDAAFARIGEVLRGLDSPDQAIFYTSGRTSNEAAFLYQLFVRQFGTNNLPDCSNMCHESSSTALAEAIGVGKGTVGLADFERSDAIFVLGQNPGTNHPRMMSALRAAKKRGCRIVSINPLRERALVRFSHPQSPGDLLRGGTEITDLFLQVRIGGDVAALRGIEKALFALEGRSPGRVLDWHFIREHTRGFDAFRAEVERTSWGEIEEASGVSKRAYEAAAAIYAAAERVIACWAMGLTQHRHGVANVREVANLLLLRGNIGRPGAGPCPVRGHSNVQGDRTMGICERPKPEFLDALAREFYMVPPQKPGFDTVAAIEAMHAGRARAFVSLGGNFAVATPDSAFTHAALRRCQLTVQISTKLNRSHLVTGDEAILLPCLGRTERDVQANGPQFVTVEDSMSVVHRSRGGLEPASPQLRSEPAIVAGMARAVLGSGTSVPWEELVANYDRIRDRIAKVVPGFENMNRRVRRPGGFVLPSAARQRRFETPSGKAEFSVNALPQTELARGELLMMTIRSHDQFNTTIYGFDDRYRGVSGDRRVVFLNPDDVEQLGLAAGQRVDLSSHFGGTARVVRDFRVVPFDLPRRCAATYFPEANALVPVDSYDAGSRTPAFKSVVIRVAPAAAPGGRAPA
ncbi:MAG: FdhF/YdeP family oxidoreductase [Deltaproteobacteria bacterium]|nr:MAG: FdhF/YdeP family oxidoreductase [Deltaproteobacteria bacterium]